jgi:hypothetical protein
MEAILGTRNPVKRADYTRYQSDPAAYCRDVLGVTLTPQQEQVCGALIRHKWILVPSANETGKSYIEGCLALWHYDCFDPGLTIITAPAAEQIRDTVFAEMRLMRPGHPDWYPSAMRLESSPKHWVKGYTARNATSFHGRHEGSVFVVFEEAEEIEPEFWVAADSMAHYFAAFYNPISTNAETVLREQSGKYHVVRLSALDHPNVAAGLAGDPPPFPKAITLDRVIDRLDKWATRIDADTYDPARDVQIGDRYWRPGPVAEARVLGRRPTGAVGTVWSKELTDKLLSTRHALNPAWPLVVGVDVARKGDDFTAIHIRRGLCSIHHEAHNGWNTVATEDRIKTILFHMTGNDAAAKLVTVNVDDIGVGGGVVDHLAAAGYAVNGVNVSRLASTDEYPDIRSQLWFDTADMVDQGLIDISRIPHAADELVKQLRAPGYEYDKKGRRVVDPKKKTKAAAGRSPDDADAFNLAYHTPLVVSPQ